MSASIPYKAQVGALPVRGKTGAMEVLLVTSRDTGRWVIPKGWPMKHKRDHEAASQEAFEEAGVRGKIHRHPMGAYTYEKRLQASVESIRVMVYLLNVHEECEAWRERGQRTREWMSALKAAALVDEAGLSEILRRLNLMTDFEPASDIKV